jgi:23S rRNA maturation mini-RNase III
LDSALTMPRPKQTLQSNTLPYMIRKLKTGEYRLYSRKKNAKTGKRRNLGTFTTRRAAETHEKAVQYFKHH